MIDVTKNNYLHLIDYPNQFKIKFENLPIKWDNFHIESLRTARELYDNKEGRFYHLYSGGIDSEYMLCLYLELKVDVVPVIIRLTPNEYNDHDLINAMAFCKERNLDPLIIDIDFDQFVESGELLKICNEMRSCKVQRSTTAKVIGMLDGTVVLGDGNPYAALDEETKQWYITIKEHEFAWPRYYTENNIKGTSQTLWWRPEQLLSYLEDPSVQNLVQNKVPGKLSTETSKHLVYNRHSGYNLKPRNKYTGYEVIRRSEIWNHKDIQEIINNRKEWDRVHRENYYEFFKHI